MPTRNYDAGSSSFETLRNLSDVTIVLDDNSVSPFPHRDQCTEYISIRNDVPWNCPANLTLLVYRAFVHGCEWVISLDDDIILSSGFQTRGDVDETVDRMEACNADICRFPLRDLWDSSREIRVDGIWSRKTFAVVRRNWFFYGDVTLRDPSLRLHTAAFPSDLKEVNLLHPVHRAYHTGCMTAELRKARVDKYAVEDAQNTFQADYSYMLDESGLKLETVPDADAALIQRKLKLHPS
jgi:hypothetical protein